MGMYDCLPKGSQVKLWGCTLRTYDIGDEVPNFNLPGYVVLLREGGYILVEEGEIAYIEEGTKNYYPEDFPDIYCFDKYGTQVPNKEDLHGELHGYKPGFEDPYYF